MGGGGGKTERRCAATAPTGWASAQPSMQAGPRRTGNVAAADDGHAAGHLWHLERVVGDLTQL